MDGGHFTGLWVEVRVILRKRNWVNKKEKKRKEKEEKNPRQTHFLVERGHRTRRIKAACHAEANEGLLTFYFFHACSTHGDLIGRDGKYRQAAPASAELGEPALSAAANH